MPAPTKRVAYFVPDTETPDCHFTPARFAGFQMHGLTQQRYIRLADGRVARPLRTAFGHHCFGENEQRLAEAFIAAVALALQPATLTPRDRPAPLRLYLIHKGAVLYQSAGSGRSMMLGSKDSWGIDDVVLSSRTGFEVQAKAITYVHVLWLDRDHFRSLAEQHPTAARTVKALALWQELRRSWRLAKKRMEPSALAGAWRSRGRSLTLFSRLARQSTKSRLMGSEEVGPPTANEVAATLRLDPTKDEELVRLVLLFTQKYASKEVGQGTQQQASSSMLGGLLSA